MQAEFFENWFQNFDFHFRGFKFGLKLPFFVFCPMGTHLRMAGSARIDFLLVNFGCAKVRSLPHNILIFIINIRI